MKSILVIEDNKDIRENTAEILDLAGYKTFTAENGKKGVDIAVREKPDVIVCDIMMPELDGYGVLHLVRKNETTQAIPFIFLTAKTERSDFRKGMEMGADDYVVKPFSPQELVSRVRAVLRRTGREQISVEPERDLAFEDILISPGTRIATVRKAPIELTAREFDLLYLLARHPKQVFTRDQLLERVWGGAEYIDPGTVTVHIRRLREKIESDPSSPSHLLTVWGVGYKFEP